MGRKKDPVESLQDMREQHASAVRKSEQLKGRFEEAQKALKEEFDVESVEEAEKLLKKLDKDIAAAQEEFETGVRALEEAYEWD